MCGVCRHGICDVYLCVVCGVCVMNKIMLAVYVGLSCFLHVVWIHAVYGVCVCVMYGSVAYVHQVLCMCYVYVMCE